LDPRAWFSFAPNSWAFVVVRVVRPLHGSRADGHFLAAALLSGVK
jgi:hypothetical protein